MVYREMEGEKFKDNVILPAGILDKEGTTGEIAIGDLSLQSELYTKHRVGWLSELPGVHQHQELF